MKNRLKVILKDLLFTALLVSTLFSINTVMVKKKTYRNSQWPSTSSYEQFYRMDPDSVDVLFLGSSYAMNAFIPQEIYDDYGITSYNLSCELQSVFTSYYWLKEALRFQSPKAVVLECRFAFTMHPENSLNTTEGLLRSAFDPMKNTSPVKWEAVHDIAMHDPDQSVLSWYLTNIRYHSRYNDLEDLDFRPSLYTSAPLKGYGPIFDNHIDHYDPFVPSDSSASLPFDAEMKVYLDKISDLCRDNNISLILVSVPSSNMSDGMNNTLTSYAASENVSYYNFSDKRLYDQIHASFPKDSLVDHENFSAAVKMSAFMGKILKEDFHISARRDQQYEDSESFYQKTAEDAGLVQITDPDDYFKALQSDHYTVLMACREDIGTLYDAGKLDHLKDLGIQADFNGKYYWSYYAAFSNGKRDESLGAQAQRTEGKTGDGLSIYRILSMGRNAGSAASITIDGREYCQNEDGLNIVVYDETLGRVIDSVTLTLKSDSIIRTMDVSEERQV